MEARLTAPPPDKDSEREKKFQKGNYAFYLDQQLKHE